MIDGKLIRTYTFQSEGVESKRQIAYMKKGNQLVEGFGELNEDGPSLRMRIRSIMHPQCLLPKQTVSHEA